MSKDTKQNYTKVTIKKLPKQEVEIEGEISAEIMARMYTKALSSIKGSITLDGFRPGSAPHDMVVAKVGEMKILEEAAEMALSTAYPEILENEKIDAIGRPQITITKIATGNPLEFKIKTFISPEVKLTDYKKIAGAEKKDQEITVSDKEIEDTILDIRKNIAHSKMHEHDDPAHPSTHNHGEIKDEDLPEVNEEFLKLIGGFKTVDELKEKIKEGITSEKKMRAKDKRRTDIIEKIITESTIELPQVIIDAELEKMLGQFKDDIARAHITYEEYLKHIKKTEDEVKAEWTETATKRAKSQIALNHIARAENITAKEEDIKREMENILSSEANQGEKLDRFRVRMFVENFLTNDLVLQFLENVN